MGYKYNCPSALVPPNERWACFPISRPSILWISTNIVASHHSWKVRKCLSRFLASRVKAGRLYPSAQGGKAYKILSIRSQGQMALLQLEGVSDMDAARALRGQVFYFDRNDATLPAGRWYVADLIGCEVRDADTGKVYGVVTSVDHPGAQDIYTVKSVF